MLPNFWALLAVAFATSSDRWESPLAAIVVRTVNEERNILSECRSTGWSPPCHSLVDAQSQPRTVFRRYSLPVNCLRTSVWNGIAFA